MMNEKPCNPYDFINLFMPLDLVKLLPPTIVAPLTTGINRGLNFQPKRKIALGIFGLAMSIPKTSGNSLLALKPRLYPSLKTNLDVDASEYQKRYLNMNESSLHAIKN
jgi:hypothetical protein